MHFALNKKLILQFTNFRKKQIGEFFMYSYETKIFLRDTDATGVLFFTEQLRLAVEAFESFVIEQRAPLSTLFETSSYVTPIVHAESDYSSPLKAGDPIEITLTLGQLGTTSFTLHALFHSRGVEKGKTSIVHVAIDKASQKPIPLPGDLVEILQKLSV